MKLMFRILLSVLLFLATIWIFPSNLYAGVCDAETCTNWVTCSKATTACGGTYDIYTGACLDPFTYYENTLCCSIAGSCTCCDDTGACYMNGCPTSGGDGGSGNGYTCPAPYVSNGVCEVTGPPYTIAKCCVDVATPPTDTPTPTVGPGTPTPSPGPTNTPIPTLPPGVTATPLPTATPIPRGTVRVRAVQVPTTATSCTDVADSTTYITSLVGLLPYGTAKNTSTDGTYTSATWTNVGQGNVFITDSPPTDYSLKFACWSRESAPLSGNGTSSTVTGLETTTWDLGYAAGVGWFQAQGGDVYAGTNLQSYIPSTAVSGRYAITNGAGGSPGIATYGIGSDFDSSSSGSGESYVSSRNWIANESYDSTDYYAILYHRFGSPTADYLGVTSLTTKLASRETPYVVDGDLSIDAVDWTVGNGESIVVFVNGSLSINKKINITGTGFVTFIVNGDITVDTLVGTTATSSTPVLEGIYITSPSGTFHTGTSSTAAARRFVAEGTFVAGNFSLERDLDADAQNTLYAAELFIYNPELMMHMPEKMKDLPVAWQEVAP